MIFSVVVLFFSLLYYRSEGKKEAPISEGFQLGRETYFRASFTAFLVLTLIESTALSLAFTAAFLALLVVALTSCATVSLAISEASKPFSFAVSRASVEALETLSVRLESALSGLIPLSFR